MKIPFHRTRNKAMALLAKPPTGRARNAPQGEPEYVFGSDGSIMVRERPTLEQARAAAEAILRDMDDRGDGEYARDALVVVRRRFG